MLERYQYFKIKQLGTKFLELVPNILKYGFLLHFLVMEINISILFEMQSSYFRYIVKVKINIFVSAKYSYK